MNLTLKYMPVRRSPGLGRVGGSRAGANDKNGRRRWSAAGQLHDGYPAEHLDPFLRAMPAQTARSPGSVISGIQLNQSIRTGDPFQRRRGTKPSSLPATPPPICCSWDHGLTTAAGSTVGTRPLRIRQYNNTTGCANTNTYQSTGSIWVLRMCRVLRSIKRTGGNDGCSIG